jgi:site-specific recombinase XerD
VSDGDDDRRDRRDPTKLSPEKAKGRYLRRRKPDSTDHTLKSWKYRLKLFVEWCEEIGIEEVGEIRGYDLDEYYEIRSPTVSPATLEGEMWTLKMLMEFLEDIEAVDDGLADSVRIPDLDQASRTNDTKLHTDAALALLEHYRNSELHYGTRGHAYLELAWHTGARQGGLRALDLRDVDLGDDAFVEFRHRPDTGTPLKNKRRGERPVALNETVADVVKTYIEEYRHDARDDHGRQPLLASMRGRPNANTIRTWSYNATLPCVHSPCPHGKQRETCKFTNYSQASKCPSSRSPHRIRTGAVTWFLNRGWPPEDVAERVNASVDTIEQHYDKADPNERRRRLRERMEDRRRKLVDQLQIETHEPREH